MEAASSYNDNDSNSGGGSAPKMVRCGSVGSSLNAQLNFTSQHRHFDHPLQQQHACQQHQYEQEMVMEVLERASAPPTTLPQVKAEAPGKASSVVNAPASVGAVIVAQQQRLKNGKLIAYPYRNIFYLFL